jgi:hypothetical protein
VERDEAEDDILHEGKAKLFVKTATEWKDMGLGTLTLRKVRAPARLPPPYLFDTRHGQDSKRRWTAAEKIGRQGIHRADQQRGQASAERVAV